MTNNDKFIAEFKADLDEYAKKLVSTSEEIVKKVATALFEGIITKNPIRTGLSMSNWKIGVNGEVDDVVPLLRKKITRREAQRIARMQLKELEKVKAGDKVYICSDVHYILKLEYGWSAQAPEGMVRITMDEVEAELERMVREGFEG